MTVILTEKEMNNAIQALLGPTYDVQEIKVIAGRGPNATRVEVEVERVEPKLAAVDETILVSGSSANGPIFDTVYGE